MTSHNHHQLLDETLSLMRQGFDEKTGLRPFGAVVAQGDKVISKGVNSCVRDHDPTAHAEINAIREACKTLGRSDLSDCVIYASAQPCPMCLAACFHAGLKAIYCATTWQDYDDLFPDQACSDWMRRNNANSSEANETIRRKGQELWETYRQTKAS